jgi:WhiB family redox-sensing transcriptional regulator
MPAPRARNARTQLPWEMPAPPGPVIDVPDWMDRALCAQVGGDAFYPEKGGSTREPKKVCMACEVRTKCLEYALDNDERYGIWGGKSERERRKIKRDRRTATEPALEVSA